MKPSKVDDLKADMLAGRFAFARPDARLAGFRDEWGVYYVRDGNHRMVAALEIERATGDPWAVHALLEFGRWDDQSPPPALHHRMPSRGWRQRLRDWFGV